MTINYKIEFLSDWHVGSGLDSGVDADALVLKNQAGLPFIPGKTIKGLLKNALMDMHEVSQCDLQLIEDLFGKVNSKVDGRNTTPGKAFFANAELPANQQAEINSHHLASYLYRNIASTAIGENGVAVTRSLRVSEVCIPVVLTGYISNLAASDEAILEKAFKWLRHLGVNRNRGLGRCKFSIIQTTTTT